MKVLQRGWVMMVKSYIRLKKERRVGLHALFFALSLFLFILSEWYR